MGAALPPVPDAAAVAAAAAAGATAGAVAAAGDEEGIDPASLTETELRECLGALGVDYSSCRTKQQLVTLLDAAVEFQMKSEEGGGENKQNDAPRAEGGSADDAEAEGPVGYDARNGDDAVLARRAEAIMSSSALADSLATVERAISQNVFHAKNLLYRGVPSVDEGVARAAKEAEENDGGVDELEALFARLAGPYDFAMVDSTGTSKLGLVLRVSSCKVAALPAGAVRCSGGRAAA